MLLVVPESREDDFDQEAALKLIKVFVEEAEKVGLRALLAVVVDPVERQYSDEDLPADLFVSLLSLQADYRGLIADDWAVLDESRQFGDLTVLLGQNSVSDFARVVILAELVENLQVLLSWQALHDDLQILLCRYVVFKIDVGSASGQLVDVHCGFDV